MNRKEEVDRVVRQIIADNPAGERKSYRYAYVIGMIQSIVKSNRTPFKMVREIKIALEALEIANETA